MLLHSDPQLAEVGDLSREQLDALAASVEVRRQQLERDINDYVRLRQDELRSYEQELLAHHRRATECPSEPEEKKRTKHSRVQKREKELYGLVTPVFLPLLDARDTSPTHKKPHNHPHNSIPEHAVATDARTPRTMSSPPSDTRKKRSSSASSAKKSALRTHASKPRRKRVSLVIDGQTVLPADTIAEPALSSEATSASNSTASLESLIDPRLTAPTHLETTHHSLPLPMAHPASPTKPLVETPSAVPLDAHLLPSSSSSSPPQAQLQDARAEDQFATYVGGLRGSGADDVDQAASYGYPSSLGASYLESYMQSRPLRVRMEAADKAGLGEEERRDMVRDREKAGDGDVDMSGDEVGGSVSGGVKDGDEDDFMGEMDGF